MLTLYLLRHAKSSWDQPNIPDFDRPLGPRGRAAAPQMGRYMKNAGYVPELVLCSPAMRARQTMDLVLPELDASPEVSLVDGLYHLGGAADLLRIIQQLGGRTTRLLVIGHNPSLEQLALSLAGTGDDTGISDMTRKFPTAALAILEFDADTWNSVASGAGRLVRFTTPRSLSTGQP